MVHVYLTASDTGRFHPVGRPINVFTCTLYPKRQHNTDRERSYGISDVTVLSGTDVERNVAMLADNGGARRLRLRSGRKWIYCSHSIYGLTSYAKKYFISNYVMLNAVTLSPTCSMTFEELQKLMTRSSHGL